MIHNLQKPIITERIKEMFFPISSWRFLGETLGMDEILVPLFLFNSTCPSFSRSLLRRGRSWGRKQWMMAAIGGGGVQPRGRKGGGGQEGGWREKKGWPPRVFVGERNDASDDFYLCIQWPTTLYLIHAPEINFWSTFFWDITLYPP